MSEESGHWYRRDGSPCHTVRARDGSMRNFNLRWDKHLQAVPSVTTVLSVYHKGALINWKEEQVAKAGWGRAKMLSLIPEYESFDLDEYVRFVLETAHQRPIDAANEGTRIHDACETYVRDGRCRDEYLKHAVAARAELQRLFPGVRDWVTEKRFAHRSGYGGSCDIHSPSTGIVCDYKTKDGDFSDGKRLGYDQHWQLAAYQDGLELPRATGAAIFISRTHPGAVSSHQWNANEMEHGSRIFKAALAAHKLLKEYDASW